MDPEELSLIGQISDAGVAKKLLDSSAQALIELSIHPLGQSPSWCYTYNAYNPSPSSCVELDLSTCDKIQHIAVHNLLH